MGIRVPRVYIETSVFNFVFADDAPEKRDHTLALFEEIRQGQYRPYTSDYVLGELALASEPKRGNMLSLIGEYAVEVLPADEDSKRLADLYVREGVIPARYGNDALHIAAATVHDLDFIVSYNFQHIVKRKTIVMAEAINLRENYRRIGIYSPTEVIEHVD